MNITIQVSSISVVGVDRATKAIADYLRGVALTSFSSESTPNGKQWTALNPSYAKRKKNRQKILQDTGQLKDSVFVQALGNEVIFRTNRPVKGGYELGALHQFGTRKMPARPFFPIDQAGILYQDDAEEIIGLIQDSLSF